jgi:large subunit ribosomal protein L4
VGIAGQDPLLYRAARNLPGVKLMPADQFNAYTVLRQKRLVLTSDALKVLREGKKTDKAPAPAGASKGGEQP